MNRRTFGISALSGLLLGGHLFAESTARFSFGFSLYGMKSLSLTDALKTCREIGYSSIELACMPGWHGNPDELTKEARRSIVKQLKDAAITCACLMESTPLDVEEKKHREQLDRLKKASELAHDLSLATPQIETVLGGKPGDFEAKKNLFRDRLGDWAKLAEQQKVSLLMKPHRMQAVQEPEQLIWLLKQVNHPKIQSVFDWSHFEQGTLKLRDTLKQLLPYSAFIHIKDTVFDAGKPRFVLPGSGSVDYRQYFQLLAEFQYTGSVCVEVSAMVFNSTTYEPSSAAKEVFTKLKALIK